MTTSIPESERGVAPDAVLSALAHEHRRVVLRSLNRVEGETMNVSALVDQVADRLRSGSLPADVNRQGIHIALHHVHLPKLEACGMIVRDAETKHVRSVTDGLTRELLSVIDSHEAAQ